MSRIRELSCDKGGYQLPGPPPKYSYPHLGSAAIDIDSIILRPFFASSIRPSNSGAREGSQGSPALDVL